MERRNRKAVKQQEVAKIQTAYQTRINELPNYLKVVDALVCDNDNKQLYVRKGFLSAEKWLCINYADIVSWRESFVNDVRVQEALIGKKQLYQKKIMRLSLRFADHWGQN